MLSGNPGCVQNDDAAAKNSPGTTNCTQFLFCQIIFFVPKARRRASRVVDLKIPIVLREKKNRKEIRIQALARVITK